MQPLSFRLGTFDVIVQPMHLLVLAYFGLTTLQGGNVTGALAIMVIVFLSILLHELGHAVVCRRLKVRHGPVVLTALGGYVQHENTKPANQLLISLAGPAAMLVVGIPVALAFDADILPPDPLLLQVAYFIALINVGWGLLNLLPMVPLDGGNALRAGLTLVTTPRTAAIAAGGVGALIGGVIALWGAINGMIFLALIGGFCAWRSWTLAQAGRRVAA